MSLSASPANTPTSEVLAVLTLVTISKSPFQSGLKSAYLCVGTLVRRQNEVAGTIYLLSDDSS